MGPAGAGGIYVYTHLTIYHWSNQHSKQNPYKFKCTDWVHAKDGVGGGGREVYGHSYFLSLSVKVFCRVEIEIYNI